MPSSASTRRHPPINPNARLHHVRLSRLVHNHHG
nr:MAG TPA: hypothetical protein [Caudoviricetes sp.]